MSFPHRSDVRLHAAVLGSALVVLYGINLLTPGLIDRAGQIKGTDFVHFYVLGALTLEGRSDALYDYGAQTGFAAQLLPEARGVTFLPIYGPQVSLLFAPLALFSYGWALVIWVLLTAALYASCCYAIWQQCPHLRSEASTVTLLAAASPAFFNLVAHGQNSVIALAAFTAAFFAIKHGKRFLAGLAIGMLIYKPQLGLVAAFVFVFSNEWKIVTGAILGAAAQLAIGWLYFGPDVMVAYWRAVLGISDISSHLAAKPYLMHSLLWFWKLLLPGNALVFALYSLCAVILLLVSWRVWRSAAPLQLRYAFVLIATVLVSPHLNVYDLVILAPAMLIVGDWAISHPEHALAKPLQRSLYFSYALPLVGSAAQFMRVQLSVIAMAALCTYVALLIVGSKRVRAGAWSVSSFGNQVSC